MARSTAAFGQGVSTTLEFAAAFNMLARGGSVRPTLPPGAVGAARSVVCLATAAALRAMLYTVFVTA